SPSTERAVIATFAPSAANRTAIAVPVPPLLAPVTRATRPAHESGMCRAQFVELRADVAHVVGVHAVVDRQRQRVVHQVIAIRQTVFRSAMSNALESGLPEDVAGPHH